MTRATIELDPDAYEIFMATRLQYCLAIGCINNALHLHKGNRPECMLKRTTITKNGICEDYKSNSEENNP